MQAPRAVADNSACYRPWPPFERVARAYFENYGAEGAGPVRAEHLSEQNAAIVRRIPELIVWYLSPLDRLVGSTALRTLFERAEMERRDLADWDWSIGAVNRRVTRMLHGRDAGIPFYLRRPG